MCSVLFLNGYYDYLSFGVGDLLTHPELEIFSHLLRARSVRTGLRRIGWDLGELDL